MQVFACTRIPHYDYEQNVAIQNLLNIVRLIEHNIIAFKGNIIRMVKMCFLCISFLLLLSLMLLVLLYQGVFYINVSCGD